MAYFAALLQRSSDEWQAAEADLDGCESLADLGDLLRDSGGPVRLLVVEQDDEYAAIVRLDDQDDDPRAFLSDGHAADAYPLAALVAEELGEIGDDELEDDEDAPPAHDSAPFGDADLVADLGTSSTELLGMCAHPGTLPIDLLVAVCEKAGCGDAFENLRG
jgi:putative tRNA adenosine deaminase-associated protein